jgi:hypothetical protein
VLPTHRRALLDRALACVRLGTLRSSLQDRYARSEIDEEGLEAEKRRIDTTQARIRRGGRRLPTVPDLSLELPGDTGPIDLALSLGPERSWWDNAVLTTKLGAVIAVAPVAYFVVVLILHGTSSSPFSFLSPVGVGLSISYEVTFWLVTAFAFGALLAYLPFATGMLKGLAVAGAYGVVVLGVGALVAAHDPVKSAFRLFELVLFLSFLGLAVDVATVGLKNWRNLATLYRVNSARSAILYLAPLALLLYAVGSQIATGHAKSAIQTAIKQASTLLPPK